MSCFRNTKSTYQRNIVVPCSYVKGEGYFYRELGMFKWGCPVFDNAIVFRTPLKKTKQLVHDSFLLST